MLTFLSEHWISLLFSLLSAGLLGYCKYLHNRFKEYKVIMEEKQKEEFEALIEQKLKETKEKLKLYDSFFETIRRSYRFRLLTLCDLYLTRGYITPKEYSQLSEMWAVYHGLLGNGQGDDYYHRVEQLPIKEHENKGNSK